ncbi:MAG: EAL domain-containing protein [Candidatus Gastranaerophilales bacterium]|nr:EAL domain-containing protein [Candidatus Gastranaerophilales bacterium]
MRRQKWQRKTAWIAAAVCMICACLSVRMPALAASDEEAPVRVVLMNYDDRGYVLTDGDEVGGYYMDYLQEIAKYTGWEYDIRVVAGEDELNQIVIKGDYDLMVGITYSEEKEALFQFPSVSMGNKHLVLAVPKTRTDLNTEDLNTLMGLRIGTISDSTYSRALSEKFKSYCFLYGIKYVENSAGRYAEGLNLIDVDSAERFELLEKGRLDGLVTSDSMALAHNLYVLDEFGEVPFYAAAPKGDDHLMAQLEEAIELIRMVDSEFEDRLYDKYFAANFEKELIFSEREEAYLAETHTLNVAMLDGIAPYAYLDENGEWKGVTAAVFRAITEMTDGRLQFCYMSYLDQDAAQEALRQGEVDIVGTTFASVDASAYGRNSSRSYFVDEFRIYRNQNYTGNFTDARIVVRRDLSDSMLAYLGVPESSIMLRVDSTEEALKLIDSGKADMTFSLQNVADCYLNYNQFSNISELGTLSFAVSLSCVYGQSVDDELRMICNKCIANMDMEELNRNVTMFLLNNHRETTLTEYIKEHWGTAAMITIGFLVIVAMVLSYFILNITRKSERIHKMLYGDEVTGGISYRKFVEDVGQLLKEQQTKRKFYVFFTDVSGFKYINEMFGYQTGDEVLHVVAGELAELSQGMPTARMYADRFVGLFPYEEEAWLERRLKKELKDFDARTAKQFPKFNLFLKMGICKWDTAEHTDVTQAVNYATYAAASLHHLSQSEFRFYTAKEHESMLKRREIERDMHRALEAGEFVAYYQPKYDALEGEIIGAEALVRWQHKDKGLISPGVFVPIFEKNHFIIEIDFCIFEQVCALLADRKQKGQKLYAISCNFSRYHFMRAEFVNRVLEVLHKYDAPAEYIEIEITETVATSDFDVLLQAVNRLKENGFKISIDDFGSGYSCIQLLYKLPIDVLKLDRVFVVDENSNATEEDVNKSIIAICHTHNIKVICEGVETEQQREFVLSYGCRYIQGFLYSKPVDRGTFLEMLN